MVGVPGRSKCCGTCRKRKKGNCDKARPSCGQCVRHGLKCDGYGRETIFLNATSGRAKQYRLERPEQKDVAHKGFLSDPLARTALEDGYLGAFWHVWLPEAREFPPSATPYTNGGWTVALPKLCSTSLVIRKSMLAVCLAIAGRTNGRERDREEGLGYYTSSLKEMAAELKGRGRVDHTTLVVTARLFSLYEVLCGYDARDLLAQVESWRKHINGELGLIISQPPETYASGWLHQFFVDGRLHLISCALHMRKRSPLSDPEWKTIPWQTIPKTPKDLIVDILAETPGLVENLDAFREENDPDAREILRRELVEKCWTLESELSAWRTKLRIQNPAYRLASPQSTFSMDVLAAAHIMCIYWVISIVVYGTLHSVIPPSATDCLPRHMDPRLYFRRIAEAVTLMVHPSSGIYGTQLTTFPTLAVFLYLDAGDRGGEEVREMIFDAYKRSGRHEIVEKFQASMLRQQRGGWRR